MNPPALYAVGHAHESHADRAARLWAEAADAGDAATDQALDVLDEAVVTLTGLAALKVAKDGIREIAGRLAAEIAAKRTTMQAIRQRNTR